MIGAAIEAAMKPLRGQLEATIVPMQRTIESLQAEFVAMRELAPAGDDDMSDAAASEMALALRDPKRGSDTDRVQTRATRLRITSSGSQISGMPPFGEWCENATAAWVLEASVLAMLFLQSFRLDSLVPPARETCESPATLKHYDFVIREHIFL